MEFQLPRVDEFQQSSWFFEPPAVVHWKLGLESFAPAHHRCNPSNWRLAVQSAVRHRPRTMGARRSGKMSTLCSACRHCYRLLSVTACLPDSWSASLFSELGCAWCLAVVCCGWFSVACVSLVVVLVPPDVWSVARVWACFAVFWFFGAPVNNGVSTRQTPVAPSTGFPWCNPPSFRYTTQNHRSCSQRSSDLTVSKKSAWRFRSGVPPHRTRPAVFQPVGNSSHNLAKHPLALGDTALSDKLARHDVESLPSFFIAASPVIQHAAITMDMFCMMVPP